MNASDIRLTVRQEPLNQTYEDLLNIVAESRPERGFYAAIFMNLIFIRGYSQEVAMNINNYAIKTNFYERFTKTTQTP